MVIPNPKISGSEQSHHRSKLKFRLPLRSLRRASSSSRLPSTSIATDSALAASLTKPRGIKESSLQHSSSPASVDSTDELPLITQLSETDRLRALLELQCPPKRRSLLQNPEEAITFDRIVSDASVRSLLKISGPVEGSFRHIASLTPSGAEAVLKTSGEITTYGLPEFVQRLHRHSVRSAFSIPDLQATNNIENLHEPRYNLGSTSEIPEDMKRPRCSYIQVQETAGYLEDNSRQDNSVPNIDSCHSSNAQGAKQTEKPNHVERKAMLSVDFRSTGHTLSRIPSKLARSARHAHSAMSNIITGAKVKLSGSAKPPFDLSWEGAEGALAFSNMTDSENFDYKTIRGIQIVLNANDWSATQDDHYEMALKAFDLKSDHRLKYLEIKIKGNTLFTRHTLTLTAGRIRMEYLKHITNVSQKYIYWQKLYDGTATRNTILEYPPHLRKKVKAIVKALLDMRNIPRVSIEGVMETELKNEIIAVCQTPRARNSPFGLARHHKTTTTRMGTSMPDFTLTEPIFKLPDANTISKSARREFKIFNKSSPKKSRFSICGVLEVPQVNGDFSSLQPSGIKAEKEVYKGISSESALSIDKPLPPAPPISLTYPGRYSDFDIPPRRAPLPPSAPQALPSMPSEYIATLPSEVHLFVDQELPPLPDIESDMLERGSDATVTKLTVEESDFMVSASKWPLHERANDMIDNNAFGNNAQSNTESSQAADQKTGLSAASGSAGPVDIECPTLRRRSTRSSSNKTSQEAGTFPTPSRKRRRPNSQISSHTPWEDFISNPIESEVIDTTNMGPLKCGTIDELVRISVHRCEPIWKEYDSNTMMPGMQTQVQEGVVGECMLGWKVLKNKAGQWYVGREDEMDCV